MSSAQLRWDRGTAYDIFVSLDVLHRPADFGIRGAWAAGVRARLSAEERDILEKSQLLGHVPFHWIYELPAPKDGNTVLWTLGQVPAAERLSVLAHGPDTPQEVVGVLQGVTAQEKWDARDRRALRAVYQEACDCGDAKKVPPADQLKVMLDLWANAEESGERFLQALRSFWEVFFAEEEERIAPALERAVTRAQELAERLPLLALLEELSQGLRFEVPPEAERLVLAPSFWCTPLIYMGSIGADADILLFGARPADASLVPGEAVPDGILRALKALSDPTRLRILHYLAQEPLSPAELSRRLRLRAPTVTHHLQTLRLAGLVNLRLGEGKVTRTYAARLEAVSSTFESLRDFLATGVE
jgi:DNA-binding transcriptional ArsR family regulator